MTDAHLTPHHDEEFKGETIFLDGATFTGCTFRSCQLVFEATANAQFFTNNVREDVQLALAGHAGITVKFLDMLFHLAGEFGRQAVEEVFDNIRRGIYYHD